MMITPHELLDYFEYVIIRKLGLKEEAEQFESARAEKNKARIERERVEKAVEAAWEKSK